MPVGIKVTRELFVQIKDELVYSEPLTVAIKNHMSVKTILQIKGAASFTEYEAMKKAQHPPTKFSIPDRLDSLELKMDHILELLQDKKLTLL